MLLLLLFLFALLFCYLFKIVVFSFFFVFVCLSFDNAAYVMTIGAIVWIAVVVTIIDAVMAIFGVSLAQIIAIVQYRIRS